MSIGLLLVLAALAQLCAVALSGRRFSRVWLVATLAGLAAALAAAILALAAGGAWIWRSGWEIFGAPVCVRLDGLGAFFLALLCVVGAAGAVYGREYWNDAAHPRSATAGRRWWSVLMLSLGTTLLASNGLHFLLGWELFAVSAYFLVTLDRARWEVRAAGWLYLAASHVGTVCLFAFFALLAASTGSWELGPLPDRTDLAPLLWLALIGFGLKSGAFPLHVWLPSAHANAPSHVSALLSGVTIKMGIYGLLRFSGWLPMPSALGWTVALVGVASAVLGVAFALGQHDLKRLLAYHSVENVGIILIGVGFAQVSVSFGQPEWGLLALAGALLHVWNHGLFKSLLFLGAGSVLHATGTREMSRLGGLWRAMPWTAGLFALGAAAISGLPPLNGFVSEWLVYLGLFNAAMLHGSVALAAVPAAILLGLTGALALACFVKVCGVVFLGAPRSAESEKAHESGPAMRGAMLALASGCGVIGLAPVACWPALQNALLAWRPEWLPLVAMPPALGTLGRAHLVLAVLLSVAVYVLWRRVRQAAVRRGPTWDCGYAVPTARMQYTAGSFAGIVTEWFAWILRPVRHESRPEEAFPARASWSEHTPDAVLEHAVVPASRATLWASRWTRRLQHGHLQAYIFYLVVGLGALTVIVLTGDGR